MTEDILQTVEQFLAYSEQKLEELAEINKKLQLEEEIE